MLESLFHAEPIADDGFSERVIGRIRRRLWLRRLTLPCAMIIGGAIAIQPLAELALAAARLLMAMPDELVRLPVTWLPQIQYVVIAAMLLGAGMLGVRMLEE